MQSPLVHAGDVPPSQLARSSMSFKMWLFRASEPASETLPFLLPAPFAQIQTLDIPGEVKAGYSPIGFVRCGRSACKITKIDWKVRSAA
jgi:hypothetical protein